MSESVNHPANRPSSTDYRSALQLVDRFVSEMLARHEHELTSQTARPHLVQAMRVLQASEPEDTKQAESPVKTPPEK